MKIVTENQLTALIERIKDKFAKKDTGWHDITALVVMPTNATYTSTLAKVLLRRIDNTVYLAFSHFGWSVSGAAARNWFPPEICTYIAPPVLPNRQMLRMGGSIISDNRPIISHFYDWLSVTDFRLVQNQSYLCHGMTSWITDTPFPTNPQGVKV